METTAGRRIADRYTLVEEIGRGGMGVVWRAEDEMLDRPVAVKIIMRDDETVARDRAVREARAAARLTHPGAVTIHDVVETPRWIAIVMELVTAPTLAAVVASAGPLEPARAARVGVELLSVIQAAHQAGIVHRDIKPSNVMLLPGDRVKLTDFGIASIGGDPSLTVTGTVLGSPAYMSPEQAGGQVAGPAADLWGVGATLYYAVEGRAPYTRSTTSAVVAAVLSQAPDPVTHAGVLAPVLTALMAREPLQRPDERTAARMLAEAAASAPDGATVPLSTSPTATVVSPTPAPTLAGMAMGARMALGGGVPRPDGPGSELAAGVRRAVRAEAGRRAVVVERRTGVVAALGGLVVVLVVGTLIVIGRGDDGNRPQRTTPRAGITAGAQAVSATRPGSPSTPPAANGEFSPDGELVGSGSAGAPGLRRLELSEAAPPGQLVAKYWRSATNDAGRYRIGADSIYEVTASGPTTYVEWYEGMFDIDFEVRVYPASTSPLDRLKEHRKTFAQAHAADAYHEISTTNRWRWHGYPAAAWEFTYNRNDEVAHSSEVAFQTGGRVYTVLYQIHDVWWESGGTQDITQDFESSFSVM